MITNGQYGRSQMLRALLILAATFFVMIIAGGSIAAWVSSLFEPSSRDCYLAQSVVQAVIIFIGTAIASAWLVSRKPFVYLRMTQKVSWRPFVGVIITFILVMPALNQLIYYNGLMSLPDSMSSLERYMREMEEMNGTITNIILSTGSVGGLISGIFIVGILTGLAEELLFRGMLQRSMNLDYHFKQWSIWIAAFIFSAVHLQFFGFFPRLLLGAFFGYLLYTTGSIWPGVFAHAFNNSIVVVTYWMKERVSSFPDFERLLVTEQGFPVWGFISLVVTALFFIFCYKWFFGHPEDRREVKDGI